MVWVEPELNFLVESPPKKALTFCSMLIGHMRRPNT